MHVTIATTVDKNEVYNLYEKSIEKSIYNHPEWYTSIITSGVHMGVFGYLEVYSDHNLIAIWPFVVRRGGVKDLFARIVEPLGAPYSDYIAPLIREGYSADHTMAVMLAELRSCLGPRTVLIIPKAVMSKEERSALHHCFDSSAYFVHNFLKLCPRMRFAYTYKETEMIWKKKHQGDIRRQFRRLGEQGRLSFYVAESRKDILVRLPVLSEMHRKEWHTKGVKSEFSDRQTMHFFQDAVESLSIDLLHYSEVRLNDHAISCHFGFVNDGWLFWYKPTYEMNFQRFSPGKVHVAMLTKWGIDHGLKGIDFLQGAERYKDLWANHEKKTETFIIASRKAYPFWIWQVRYREKAKGMYQSCRNFVVKGLKL
jgi:CelD/BcsL family acetyltransferase involved in cellulose biosynthesis